MIEPRLNYVTCAGASTTEAGRATQTHQMAYWEWNETGDPHHPHVIVCVHGLTRQGRDFDTLARALCHKARVICPDVAGRGQSDWLAEPMAYQVPAYAADMLALLAQIHSQGPISTLDWIGTSMGGLIGIVMAGQAGLPLPVPIHSLILNDVGPVLEWSALKRIGSYVGAPVQFTSLQQAADALGVLSASFGPHTPEQWLALSIPMVKPAAEGKSGYVLHYDPAVAVPMAAMTEESSVGGQATLWRLYDQITARTLLLRGAQSDLLTRATAQAMAERGPQAPCVEFAGVGHAPTLVAADQVQAVLSFLFASDETVSG